MYVDRDAGGAIIGAWCDRQRKGQELVALEAAELQAFLTPPSKAPRFHRLDAWPAR